MLYPKPWIYEVSILHSEFLRGFVSMGNNFHPLTHQQHLHTHQHIPQLYLKLLFPQLYLKLLFLVGPKVDVPRAVPAGKRFQASAQTFFSVSEVTRATIGNEKHAFCCKHYFRNGGAP